MTTSRPRSVNLRATATLQAQALQAEIPGVQAVLVCSADGFELASALSGDFDAARLAALASSMAAIGEVVSAEGHLGSSRCVIVETESGYVVVRAVPRPGAPVVLLVVASTEAVLGFVKFRSEAMAQALLRCFE